MKWMAVVFLSLVFLGCSMGSKSESPEAEAQQAEAMAAGAEKMAAGAENSMTQAPAKMNKATAGVCSSEIQTICPGVKAGEGLMKCMRQNKDKFSAECKQQFQKKRQGAQNAIKDCRADMDKFCKGIQPGDGRLIQCLHKNKAQVSAQCQAHLNKKPAKK